MFIQVPSLNEKVNKLSLKFRLVGNFEINETEICISSEVISISLSKIRNLLGRFYARYWSSVVSQASASWNKYSTEEHITLCFSTVERCWRNNTDIFVTPNNIWLWSSFSFYQNSLRLYFQIIKVLTNARLLIMCYSQMSVKMATTPWVWLQNCSALVWLSLSHSEHRNYIIETQPGEKCYSWRRRKKNPPLKGMYYLLHKAN